MKHHRHGDRRNRSIRNNHKAQNRLPLTCLQSIPENDCKCFGLEQQLQCDYTPTKSTIKVIIPSPHLALFPRFEASSSFEQVTYYDGVDDYDDVTPYELINYERKKRGLLPFRLSRRLNELASQQAHQMAMRCKVHHSVTTVDELKQLLKGNDVAENIHRGDTTSTIHTETMRQLSCVNRSNILSIYFSDFGYGVATGRDGMLYCCQLFRN
jgi:uncharacterized protein YkwD